MNRGEKGVKFGAERMIAQLEEFYFTNALSEDGDESLELKDRLERLVKEQDWSEAAQVIVSADILINSNIINDEKNIENAEPDSED